MGGGERHEREHPRFLPMQSEVEGDEIGSNDEEDGEAAGTSQLSMGFGTYACVLVHSPPRSLTDEEDEEDGFVVPHGYLSDDEGAADHEDRKAQHDGALEAQVKKVRAKHMCSA